MREFVSSVSPKGQITLPVDLRRELGIMPKSKVTLRLEGDTVRVQAASFTLAQVFGSVVPSTDTEDLIQAEWAAHEEAAEREAGQLRDQ